MNKFYLSFIKNTILSSKPSISIRLLLMVLFVCLFSNVASAQTTLFQFNFENTINPNVDNVVGVPSFTSNGVTNQGYITTLPCEGARMYTADNWDTNNYYQFTVNTTGFANMTFSFCNRTDNTNIGTFIVTVSADNGTNWTPVLASYTPTTGNITLSTGTFPTVANNASSVLIRINKTNNANSDSRDFHIDNAILTGYSIPTISSFTPTNGCSNSTSVDITGTNFTGVSAVRFGGTNAASYIVNSSTRITAIPAAGATGAISVTTSGGSATSGSNFTVNTPPTVLAFASPVAICSGGNVTLSASVTTPTTQNTVLLYEGFNGGTISWTKINNSFGGTPAYADWTLRPDGYSYAYFGYPTRVFHSNDNSQFYLSNSAAQGNATTATLLQSPIMNTVGYTSLSLLFYQYNLDFDNSDYARVEVSTNGSTWTIVSETTTTQGAENNFSQTTINLNAYINQPTLYVRFRYDAQFDWFWAIDNVTVSGNKTIDYTYSWSASPSGTAGLPSGAGTASTSNNSIVANPTITTSYTVTATNPITGCAGTANVNVTVNPASVGGTVSGGSTPICQGSSIGTLTLSGYTGTILRWERNVNSGGWNYAGGSSTTFTESAIAGTCEYRAVVQSGSCAEANSSSVTIVVSPTPVGGGVYNGNTPICLNSSTGSMTLGGGYVGNVVRWEKRLLPAATWTSIANTTLVYSESPAVDGTWEYRAVVGSGSCTEVYSSAFSVTVNPALTITLTNTNATVCQNTTTASFAYSATTGTPAACTVDFDSAANAAGFTDLSYIGLGSAPNKFSVNVPWAAAAGVYNATLTLKTDWPSCTSTASYPITVTVGVLTPIVGTLTQPSCTTPTGSVVLSGLPASGTINQTGTVITNYVITGTTMTISGLTAGSYNFAASNGSCSSSATGNVVIIAPTTATWTGSAWVNGPPTPSQPLEFSGDYNSSGDLTACSCKVTGSKNVVINSGHSLTITNEVTVIGTGTLTFENNASLVQINNVTNVGNITYKRATTTIREFDFTYWSSPVAGQNLLAVSPTSKLDKFFYFDAAANDWVQETPSTTTMDIGKGYIIRGVPLPVPPAPGFYQAPFYGVPNNGDISITVTGEETSNLIGNPYPSAIYADQFLFDNQSSIDGTIYFWTHNTPIAIGTPDPGTGAWAYSGNDYASYSLTGGVGTGSGIGSTIPGTPPTENVSNRPTGKIAAGQSFFTTSTAAGGPVKFTNAMRVDGSGNPLDNSNFYRTKNSKSKKVSAIEKNRVWLNLTNKQGAFKQTLVGYITGASNSWDKLYDGESFDGNDFLDFYSINDEKNLTIQGRALPFDENDEIPLGYRIAVEGTFTINIGETDGLLANQAIFLEDKLTNTVFDLKTGNYTFNTAAGTFDDRFVLRYTSKTLGTNDLEISSNKVLVSIKNKQIKIDSFAETIDGVAIYDVAGRQIYQKNKVNSNELSIPNFVSSHQILIVKTTLQNGKTVSNKIVY